MPDPGPTIPVVIEYLLDGHQYPWRCQAEEAAGSARKHLRGVD
jgi:hypothetical protein